MRIRWRGLELPSKVIADKSSLTDTYGHFTIEPFERGFGTTVGNSLRRIMLSSLEGAAVYAVRIDGSSHEFTALPGIQEDGTEILLNIKKIRVKLLKDQAETLTLDVDKSGEITAGDLVGGPNVEVVNPDLVICNATKKTRLKMELFVQKGRGYLTALEHEEKFERGVIPVDSSYSPIKRVRYKTEYTRVGKLTNYDKLSLEIWTDGTISPEMALVEAAKIFRKHLIPFVQYFEPGFDLQRATTRKDEEKTQLSELHNQNISELDLSVRASNCLDAAGVATIGELVNWTEDRLLKVRNFGKTSLDEIKSKLNARGLSLGMKVPEEAAV